MQFAEDFTRPELGGAQDGHRSREVVPAAAGLSHFFAVAARETVCLSILARTCHRAIVQKLSMSDFRKEPGERIRDVYKLGRRFLITKAGKAVAMLVPVSPAEKPKEVARGR